MTQGRAVPGRDDFQLAPPDDTGEADWPAALAPDGDLRLRPVAVRRALRPGRPPPRRAARAPGAAGRRARAAPLRRRPRGAGVRRRPAVAFHAVRNLARLALGTATLRWTQLGFGRT